MKMKKKTNIRTFMVLMFSLSFLLFPMISKSQAVTNDVQVLESYLKSIDSVLATTKSITAEDTQKSLLDSAKIATVNLLKPIKKVLTGNTLYEKAKLATVITGCAYKCPRCSNTHLSESSGYIIDPTGIVITNYHVMAQYAFMKDGNKPVGFFVRLADGHTFAVKSILASSKKNDLAVLQLETNGVKLPALALGDPAKVGDPIYVLGHPKGMHYYLSNGIVNNNYLEEAGGDGQKFFREMMAISADYATGSSGGPILDAFGNVVGTVSNTKMLLHSDMNPTVQMVLKNTVPVKSLRKLLR